jgi:hypothetical protein
MDVDCIEIFIDWTGLYCKFSQNLIFVWIFDLQFSNLGNQDRKNCKKIQGELERIWDKGFDALQNVFIALQKLENRTKKKTIKKVRQNPNKAKN